MSSEGRFDRALLERHKPLYRLDSQEAYGLLSAASMTDNPGNSLIRESGYRIARAGGTGAQLSLSTLEDYPRGRPRDTDRLAHAPGRFRDAVEMGLGKRGRCYPDRVYGRVIDHGGLTWLQYWSWHYHNATRVLGIGEHEGDWELVQVGLEGGRPRRATFAQHSGGESRDWSAVARRGARPVIYVAPGSHAAYFRPGTQIYALRYLADNPDGAGPEVDPTLLRFGDWSSWPGIWGRRTAVGRRLTWIVGDGPRSPARQRQHWSRPSEFDSDARARPNRDIGWKLGRLFYPRDPLELEVLERDGLGLRVRYKLPWFRAGSRLLVSAHDPARAGAPLIGGRWVHAPGRQRTVEVGLIAALRGDSVVVRASAYNPFDQRSNCVGVRAKWQAGRSPRNGQLKPCRRPARNR